MHRLGFANRQFLFLTVTVFAFFTAWSAQGVEFSWQAAVATSTTASQKKSKSLAPTVATALRYINAIAADQRVRVGQLDFACQFSMVASLEKGLKRFPPKSDPVYEQCWKTIQKANSEPLVRVNQGMHVLWPGQDRLVFFGEDLKRHSYAPSAFVSDLVSTAPNKRGFRTQVVHVEPMPPASFRMNQYGDILVAPATQVHVQVRYQDPLLSPGTYAPGAYHQANPVKRPRASLKAVTLRVVVLSGLQRLGFPGDLAVVNLLAVPADGLRPAVPLLAAQSGYVIDSAEWWGSKDNPDLLIAAVGKAAQLADLQDRVGLLNRVLIIDPDQADALTGLTRDLFQAILDDGASTLSVTIESKALASRFMEFYWDTYSLHERMDISLGMEMGGFSKATTADYLFRMIPAMEQLATIRPEDLENRFRLGVAYRWNLDQLTAIEAHEALVGVLPPERGALRARALTELAWSRIAKVAFNRTFDDPGIRKAYQEAEEAYNLSSRPLDKFTAAYTMAYSLVYTPDRDNTAILSLLTDAKQWYLQIDGGTEESWNVLLGNDTLKPVIDADPALKQLVSAAALQG